MQYATYADAYTDRQDTTDLDNATAEENANMIEGESAQSPCVLESTPYNYIRCTLHNVFPCNSRF
jgi:hypothetical protein